MSLNWICRQPLKVNQFITSFTPLTAHIGLNLKFFFNQYCVCKPKANTINDFWKKDPWLSSFHFGFLGHSKTTFFIAVCSKIPLNSTFFWSLALCATCILLPPPFPPIESEAFLNLAIKVTTYNLIPICKNFPIWYIKSKGWGLEVGEKDFPNRYLCRFTHFFPSFKYITRSKYQNPTK